MAKTMLRIHGDLFSEWKNCVAFAHTLVKRSKQLLEDVWENYVVFYSNKLRKIFICFSISRKMPGKVPGLKVELRDSKNRKLSSSSRRLSDASRSSIMSPTVLSVKVGPGGKHSDQKSSSQIFLERRLQRPGRGAVGLGDGGAGGVQRG